MQNPSSGVLPALDACCPDIVVARRHIRDVITRRCCPRLPSESPSLTRLASFLLSWTFCNNLSSAISCTKYPIPGCHDDPEGKRQDAIRAKINAGYPFDSFAAERSKNFVNRHIDGHDYMWALSEPIHNAGEVIFIQGFAFRWSHARAAPALPVRYACLARPVSLRFACTALDALALLSAPAIVWSLDALWHSTPWRLLWALRASTAGRSWTLAIVGASHLPLSVICVPAQRWGRLWL
ncbi:hypothetical protein B0H16DRAFT_1777340 [Mycena metata]|uniref:Uncharacterized protein n=1 Tax=Mycena metata TaxID=1033252 RepID=A0AAD7HUM6_9AGAR|nr:hypothetical protein B0H16DRAFT_1777340 [Mycena metata]